MAATQPEQPSSLEARVNDLERLLRAQEERIATQEAQITAQREELAQLRAPAPMPFAMALPVPSTPLAVAEEAEMPSDAQPTEQRAQKSRRALLKLGGAVAAAGVAAAAAGATELAHPGTAHAADNPGNFTSSVNTTPAVTATGTNGAYGIVARSDTGFGIQTSAPIALDATGYVGVTGAIDVRGGAGPFGVRSYVTGDGVGGIFGGGGAPIFLQPSMSAGPPTTGFHSMGEIYPDSAGALWYCNVGSTRFTPATWVELTRGSTPPPTPKGLLTYLSTPIRLFDSRGGTPAPLPNPKGALAGQSTTTIQVTGMLINNVGVPMGATGVFGNLTVTNTQGAGDLILWPDGATQPNASNINYGQGQTVANSFNVGLSAGGAMDIFVHVNGTDVIIDIAGYVL